MSNHPCYDCGMKIIRNLVVPGLTAPAVNRKELPPELLFYWLAKPRNFVLASSDPLAKMLIRAMLKGEAAQFIYVGG
jgi:hypothetical protein